MAELESGLGYYSKKQNQNDIYRVYIIEKIYSNNKYETPSTTTGFIKLQV